MRTLRTIQPSSSGNEVRLTAPAKWAELTQEQLRYVLTMLSQRSSLEVKVLMVLRFCGIEVLKKTAEGFKCKFEGRCIYLRDWQVQHVMHTFDYIDGYEDYSVRLDGIGNLHPVDVLLHGVPFAVYLSMEKYYQGFLRNKGNKMLLERLGQLMYVKEDGSHDKEQHFTDAEGLHCFLWFSWVKKEFGRYFPHFFKPSGGTDKGTELSILDQMNVQIRALTGGDVTKEKEIFELDCWRALTELNAKAWESAEIKKHSKK